MLVLLAVNECGKGVANTVAVLAGDEDTIVLLVVEDDAIVDCPAFTAAVNALNCCDCISNAICNAAGDGEANVGGAPADDNKLV